MTPLWPIVFAGAALTGQGWLDRRARWVIEQERDEAVCAALEARADRSRWEQRARYSEYQRRLCEARLVAALDRAEVAEMEAGLQ